MSDLNSLAKEFHEYAKSKGFWDDHRDVGTLLMLMVSELSETLEADRNGRYAKIDGREFIIDGRTIREDLDLAIKENDMVKFEQLFKTQVKDTFEDEVADTFIRLLDFVGKYEIDIEKHIELKMKYNQLRPYKHNKAY